MRILSHAFGIPIVMVGKFNLMVGIGWDQNLRVVIETLRLGSQRQGLDRSEFGI